MRTCLICKRCYDDEVSFCETDGAQTASIIAGPRVLDGKYEIERLLGQGGMGAVFEAVQRGIERKVAIKLINPSFVSNEQALERFKREALASGRVKHPNAITVYDFGVTDEAVAYLAMEFLNGSSLRAELQRVRVMEPARVLEILGPVCAAVESAHRQNIVHRDLKPDNVFLEELDDGTVQPKVLDFGIAKLRTAQAGAPDLTGEGSSIGTPAYMSPEQAKGLHLDARSDVYALGVIAYEMLSGSLPFQSSSPMGFLVQHMMEAPIPLGAANPRVSPALEEAVMRALDKSPDVRPQSALEFGRSLASALEAGSAPRPAPAIVGFQETVSFLRRLGADTIAAGRSTSVEIRLLGWPVGIAVGVAPEPAADAFAELARELVAAAAQRVPYEIVFRGAREWAVRRLSSSGLVPPSVVQPIPGAAPRTAGLAFYCAQEGLAWAVRMPNNSELPILLRTPGGEEPHSETIAGTATYFVGDLPGGHVVTLVARLHGVQVWSNTTALVDGATTLVLCVPEPDATATQNPEMFAHLFGTLEITCTEGGGEIFVDDGPVPWGVTVENGPALLYCVVPGSHRVRIRKEYYVPTEGTVSVEAGKRAAFHAVLARNESSLELSANVNGVTVEVIGPDPSTEVRTVVLSEAFRPQTVSVPTGAYVVRAAIAGFAPWEGQVALRGDASRRVDIPLRPIACPLCGQAAGADTFVCRSCRRANVHAFHRYLNDVCIECAARSAFDRARAEATAAAFRGYLDAFRSANARLTKQAELELRRLADRAREAELAERAERFAKLAASNQIADVVASWMRMTAERPADAEAHLALATALEAAGDRPAALASYRHAVERAPSDAFIRRELGRILAVLRMPADAVREYTAAVTLKPDFSDAHFELANLLVASGQQDSAVEGFRMAAASKPSNPVFHESYGRALAQRGRFREASEAFRYAASGYRRDGNIVRAEAVEQWSHNAANQTALHKAEKLVKGLFE